MSFSSGLNSIRLSERIRRFRDASRVRGAAEHLDNARFHEDLYQAYYHLYAELPLRERQARTFAWALARLPVYLFPDECFTGMIYHLGPGPDVPPEPPHPFDWALPGIERTKTRLPENRELVDLKMYTDNAIPGHVTWHWDWFLEKGLDGMLGEYRTAQQQTADPLAREFYRGVIIRLEAMLEWHDRHVAALEAALAAAAPAERNRLEAQLQLCRRVPQFPARNFTEAIQSFYFQYLAVMRENPHGGNGPGRLDYFLWPYLEKDLQAGVITMESARDLIQELFIRIHERIQPADGWVETIVVGGCHPDGSPAVSPLSSLLVEAFIALDQTHPAVYVRLPDPAPKAFVRLAAEYLLNGKNRAQILNDREIMAAMQRNGMPLADAAMYTCGGCMEIVPQGMNSDLLFAATHNVAKVVELALTGGVCLKTGRKLAAVNLPPLTAHATFDQLYGVFSAEMQRELGILFKRLDFFSETMAECRPAYLLSAMTADCFARGRELHDGGARYPDYGATPLGVPNAGDALYAVKKAVFDDKFCTAAELLEALRADFKGYERLQNRLRALPKFGQEQAEADAMTDRVLTTICDYFAAFRNRWGGRIKPIIFTFVWAPEIGATLGATAYGDNAGRPIAQGLTPQSRAMTEGITAAINSHTALTLEKVAGAASSMWDLDPRWATATTTEVLLETFLNRGGMIFQGNTTDVSELIHARERPDDYPNLIVRVGGFSARFVALSPELQTEIIERYRHAK